MLLKTCGYDKTFIDNMRYAETGYTKCTVLARSHAYDLFVMRT